MKTIKKIKWILIAIGITVFFATAHYSLSKYLGTWIFFLLPIIFAFCIFLTLAKINNLKEIFSLKIEELDTAKVFGIPMVSAVFCFLVFGFYVAISAENKFENDLEKYGIITDGIVLDIKHTERYGAKGSKYDEDIATVEFVTEDNVVHRYEQHINFYEFISRKNELIKVKYLSDNPQEFKIIIE